MNYRNLLPRLSGCALALILLLFSAGNPTLGQCVVTLDGCTDEYFSSGSSGNCTTDYAQLYCFVGAYCDVTVTTCEGSNYFSRFISCNCYI